MMTLKELMAAGDDLLETRVVPGAPDWQSLHAGTPDDTEDGEEAVALEDDAVIAANADDPPEVAAMLEKMAKAVENGAIVDEQVMADLLGAAWIRSASREVPSDQ